MYFYFVTAIDVIHQDISVDGDFIYDVCKLGSIEFMLFFGDDF